MTRAGSLVSVALSLVAVALAADAGVHGRGAIGSSREHSLLQTWGKMLDGTGSKANPIARVVGLLKEMSATLGKEQEEDEELYDKLACWCNNNNYEKDNAIKDSESKIEQLEASIESLTAKSAELNTRIKELNAQVATDKEALAKATAMREKQLKEFHGGELDSIQAIENLKAALVVLSKHHGGAFPQISLSLLAVSGKDGPWAAGHESGDAHSLGEFMRHSGMDSDTSVDSTSTSSRGFLQHEAASPQPGGWSLEDVAVVRNALGAATSFAQSRHEYFPSYNSQSGEIVGVLKQLKEEMEGDLSESQKTEQARAASFAELRDAKTAEIENGEKMAEQKEDELATTDNSLAEAKEDLGQEQTLLEENQKFVKNLKETCATADKDFAARKNARMEETKAVSEAIEILTEDDSRDAMKGTFSFLQVSSDDQRRNAAAKFLRQAARKSHSPELLALATTVELDAFTKVKKAIDDMVGALEQQQADEVKKNDWCRDELQSNDMDTMKKNDEKADLEAKIEELRVAIKTLEDEIAQAKANIAQNQVDLQRASENRKAENLDFQTVVADQAVTRATLEKALDKLATYYDQADLLQKHTQTPPVAQKEYKPSKGASGVMQMIEKVIYDTKELTAKSKAAESEAQAAYEALVADTNAAVQALQNEVVSKTKAKTGAKKDKGVAEGDLASTNEELEGLAKYNADLHAECDYVQKNFEIRQQARAEEIEALKQAKQILSGADLSA